jgi:hypothetical protein
MGADSKISRPPTATELPSWAIGLCGVAAVASALFTVLLFLNR